MTELNYHCILITQSKKACTHGHFLCLTWTKEATVSWAAAAPVRACFLSFIVTGKIEDSPKMERKAQAEHMSHILLIISYLGESVKSKFWQDKINDLALSGFRHIYFCCSLVIN